MSENCGLGRGFGNNQLVLDLRGLHCGSFYRESEKLQNLGEFIKYYVPRIYVAIVKILDTQKPLVFLLKKVGVGRSSSAVGKAHLAGETLRAEPGGEE